MDPLTAVGLTSNIISFIDFAAKVVDTTVEIHQSVSGARTRTSLRIVCDGRLSAALRGSLLVQTLYGREEP
jgi:hypothetical protein